jgi:hypothetical protein
MSSLSSVQMAEFVRDGCLRLDAVIPQDLCRTLLREIEAGFVPTPFATPATTPARGWVGRPVEEVWGDDTAFGRVLRLPAVRGVVHGLVGEGARYDHHAIHVSAAGSTYAQPYHADAIIDTRLAFDIQLFFFFHEVRPGAGGTLYLPGSHLRRVHEFTIGRCHNVVGQRHVVCPAGSVVIFHHGLWHAGQPNVGETPRYALKLRLNPSVKQERLFDTRDLDSPAVKDTLLPEFRWHGVERRLELVQRALLWRYVSGDATADIEYYLTRLENQAEHAPPVRSLTRV